MKSHPFLVALIFLFGCGGGGGGGGSTPVVPAATVSLSADTLSVLVSNASTLTWSSTNATACSASWTAQTSTSGSAAVTISTAGNNTYAITCTGAGAAGSASVIIEGYRNTDGVVVDGYISGAEVCIDENNSWTCDSNENTTTSDNDGKFTIKYANGSLVSIGGTDLDSQTLLDKLLITHKLTGHSDFKVITPVTSLAAFMTDAANINAALGIDSTIDVFTFDPVVNKGDGGINDYLYEKGNQLTVIAYALQNIANNLNTTTETTQDYFQSMAEVIDAEYAETESRVNIETEAFITKALDRVISKKTLTLDDTNKTNTISALTSILPVIQVKANDANTIAIFNFATSTFQSDAQAMANGSATSEVISSYQTDILNYVATDQNLVASELQPDITAIIDSVTTDEDISIDINVLNNDSYLTTASISVGIDNPSDGTASVSNNIVTYVPDDNFFGTDSISYTISQNEKISSSNISIVINSVNDVPIFDNLLSTYTVDENQTAVTSISASDVEKEALTISLGGTDQSSFNLSSANVLTFNESPDYETKTSYELIISVTDGIDTLDKNVSVNLNNLNDNLPVFTSNETFSADENQTAIGTVTATDADGNSLSFTVSGSELAITSAGVLTFASAPDYETKSSYTATVSVSDSIVTTTQNITVNVSDINEAPVATAASYAINLLPQSQTSKTLTLTGTDQDGNTLTYAIASNGTHGTASLSGSTITYQTAANTQSAQSDSFTFTANDGTVDSSAATISLDLRTDPLYQYQWHLNNTGQTNFATNAGTAGQDLNVDSVIVDGVTGNGIKISIVDDGLEIAHEDLVDNIIGGSWNFLDSSSDPTNLSSDTSGGHGTSIAGLIAAKGWNNKGGRGIAPNASIFGYNLLAERALYYVSETNGALGVNSQGGVTADIYNMSYGADYEEDDEGDLLLYYDLPSYVTSIQEQKYINGTSNLRDGKGANYVWAAGNEYNASSVTDVCGTGQPLSCTETSIDSDNAMPYLIAVGALNADGLKTSYSTPGAGNWVSGFGGEYGYNSDIYSSEATWSASELAPAIMTVDRSGCSVGYSKGEDGENAGGNNTFDVGGYGYADNTTLNSTCSYISTFNGTSAAAPTVAGVIALMLEANPDLTWRDVKHILALTSDKVDADRTTSVSGISQYSWVENAAGYEHHNWYGFGKVNSAAAVNSAKSYTADSLGSFIDSGYVSNNVAASIPDLNSITSNISVTKPSGSNGIVEFVRVSLKFDHSQAWSVGVRLLSPDNTVINLMQPFTNISNPGNTLFEIGASGFYGESMEGNWTIELIDYSSGTTGTFTTWGIQVYGN
jgi:subtilisin family serine protease